MCNLYPTFGHISRKVQNPKDLGIKMLQYLDTNNHPIHIPESETINIVTSKVTSYIKFGKKIKNK